MDVSACPLLRQLYLTDVHGVRGWIRRGKLVVCVETGDKVHIIFLCDGGQKMEKAALSSLVIVMLMKLRSRLTACEIEPLCYCASQREHSYEVWSWTFVLHQRVWTHPSLYVFLHVPVIEGLLCLSCFKTSFRFLSSKRSDINSSQDTQISSQW